MLQEWLYLNIEVLSKNGYFLPLSADTPNNRKLAAFCQPGYDDYYRANNIHSIFDRAAFFAGFEAELTQEITEAQRGHHSVIISSEHFSSRLKDLQSVETLAGLLKPLFDDVTIICYVREQSQLRNSLYSTALREGEVSSLDDFARLITDRSQYYNYDLMLDKWVTAFPNADLRIGIYDRALFEQSDIRKDFLKHIGFLSGDQALDYSVQSSNSSLSRIEAILIRLVNEYTTGADGHPKDPAIRQALLDKVSAAHSLSFGQLVGQNDIEIYKHFDACNRRFFKRFFDREENLFRPPEQKTEAMPVSHENLNVLDDVLFEIVHGLLRIENPQLPASYISTSQEDVNLFRDVALGFDKNQPPTKAQSIRLMEIAHKARPLGPAINDFLRRHRDAEQTS